MKPYCATCGPLEESTATEVVAHLDSVSHRTMELLDDELDAAIPDHPSRPDGDT